MRGFMRTKNIGFISQRDIYGNIIQNEETVNDVLSMFEGCRFISGNSKGNEHLLEQKCLERGLEFVSINPDTSGFGFELAFLERNREIIKQSDIVVLVFDGFNKFGLNVIKEGLRLGKKVICMNLK